MKFHLIFPQISYQQRGGTEYVRDQDLDGLDVLQIPETRHIIPHLLSVPGALLNLTVRRHMWRAPEVQ